MATIELTDENFRGVVDKEGILLVDFWAAWCGPCRSFGPIFERAADANPDIVFGKVDTEAEPELSGDANITSIPNLMVFRDGIVVFNQPGALPASALEQLIAAVRALDMADVRRQLAEQARASA